MNRLNINVWILTLPSILSDQNVSWLMNSTVDLMKPSFFLELEKFLLKLAAQFWNDLLENKPNMKTDKRSSNTLRYLSMMDIRVTPLIWLEEDTSHVEQKHTFFHCNPRYGTQQKKFFFKSNYKLWNNYNKVRWGFIYDRNSATVVLNFY